MREGAITSDTRRAADRLLYGDGPTPSPFAVRLNHARLAKTEPADPPPPAAPRPTPKVKNLQQLRGMVFPPRRWIVEGILQEGSCMLLAGKGKIGKSYLVLSIAVAVGTGGRVLGKLRAEPCNVLYLCLEDGEELLQERTEQMLSADPDADVSGISYVDSWAPLSDGGLEDLAAYLAENPDTRLAIIDTLKKVRESVGANDRRQLYDIDYDSLSGLTKLAHERRISVVVIHHTKKGEAEDPIDLISGSIGLSASVDGAMVLTRKRMEQDAELMVAYRGMSERAYSLYRDQETNGWIWAGDAEERRVSAEREAIIEVLRNQSRPMKPREVAEALDRLQETGNIGRLMNTMLGQGQLEQTRYGQYSLPPQKSDRTPADNNGQRMSGERREIIATIAAYGQPMRPADVATALGRPQDAGNIQRLMNTMATDGQLSQIKYGQYSIPPQKSDRDTDLTLGTKELYTTAKTTENIDPTNPTNPTDLDFGGNSPQMFSQTDPSQITRNTRIGRIADSHDDAVRVVEVVRMAGGRLYLNSAGGLSFDMPPRPPPGLDAALIEHHQAIIAWLRANGGTS